MSEAAIGRPIGRALAFYLPWYGALCVVVMVALFVAGKAPTAIGVLLGPCFVGALALKFKRALPKGTPKRPRPGGMVVQAVVAAMPGAILIFVGSVIGGAFIECFCTAVGTTFLGLSGLLIAIARTFPRA